MDLRHAYRSRELCNWWNVLASRGRLCFFCVDGIRDLAPRGGHGIGSPVDKCRGLERDRGAQQ